MGREPPTHEVQTGEVKHCGLAIDADAVQVSNRNWSWLQIPLTGVGTTKIDFNNAQTLNRLEVWLRLSASTAPRSLARRVFLRDKVEHFIGEGPRAVGTMGERPYSICDGRGCDAAR